MIIQERMANEYHDVKHYSNKKLLFFVVSKCNTHTHTLYIVILIMFKMSTSK